MSELYRKYRNDMMASRTYAEMDAVEVSALRSYLCDDLSLVEYSSLYSLGSQLIYVHGWH